MKMSARHHLIGSISSANTQAKPQAVTIPASEKFGADVMTPTDVWSLALRIEGYTGPAMRVFDATAPADYTDIEFDADSGLVLDALPYGANTRVSRIFNQCGGGALVVVGTGQVTVSEASGQYVPLLTTDGDAYFQTEDDSRDGVQWADGCNVTVALWRPSTMTDGAIMSVPKAHARASETVVYFDGGALTYNNHFGVVRTVATSVDQEEQLVWVNLHESRYHYGVSNDATDYGETRLHYFVDGITPGLDASLKKMTILGDESEGKGTATDGTGIAEVIVWTPGAHVRSFHEFLPALSKIRTSSPYTPYAGVASYDGAADGVSGDASAFETHGDVETYVLNGVTVFRSARSGSEDYRVEVKVPVPAELREAFLADGGDVEINQYFRSGTASTAYTNITHFRDSFSVMGTAYSHEAWQATPWDTWSSANIDFVMSRLHKVPPGTESISVWFDLHGTTSGQLQYVGFPVLTFSESVPECFLDQGEAQFIAGSQAGGVRADVSGVRVVQAPYHSNPLHVEYPVMQLVVGAGGLTLDKTDLTIVQGVNAADANIHRAYINYIQTS